MTRLSSWSVKFGCAAFCRHGVKTVQSVLEKGIEALCDTGSPFAVVFDFRRVGYGFVCAVTLNTDFVENLIAFAFADGDAVAHRNLSDRLDAGLGGGFGGGGYVSERTAACQFDAEENDCKQDNDAAHKGDNAEPPALIFLVVSFGRPRR